jgi:hypothetical protein
MSHIGQKCDRLTQFFSIYEENKTLAKEDRVKMSPFYVEGDRGGWQKRVT